MALLPGSSESKFARVANLIRWGFNAPAYYLFSDPRIDWFTFSDSLYNCFPSRRVSIRSVAPLMKGKYGWIDVEIWRLEHEWIRIKSIFPIMVSEGIPIATYSGCIGVDDRSEFILELVEGLPVRGFTHAKASPSIRIHSQFGSDRWRYYSEYLVVQAIEEASKIPLKDYILEFSIFDAAYGVKRERILFWEYEETKPWTQDWLAANRFLTMRVTSSWQSTTGKRNLLKSIRK